MIQDLNVSSIRIGRRLRKDIGDIRSLAESIRTVGLLQPIGVTEKMGLVFGERRSRANRDILKRKTILARIVDVPSIISAEYAENEIRKDFTPSERVAIAKSLEKQLPSRNGVPKARQQIDNLRGQRTDAFVAAKAGFGNHQTYRQAVKVLQNGSPRLIPAMNEGRVSISAAPILSAADGENWTPYWTLMNGPSYRRPRRFQWYRRRAA